MNPPSIDLYRNRGVDLSREPLEIAVCAQHNNGGFAVDRWWESNVPHLFVIGEQAGTHGVKRPGGSALNAGQVGGLRAAQRIAHAYGPHVPSASEFLSAIGDTVAGKLEAIRADPPRRKRPRCAEEAAGDTAAHDRLRWRLAQPGGSLARGGRRPPPPGRDSP